MRIKYLCPYWGSEGVSAKDFIHKVLVSGYDGIEINLPDRLDFTTELRMLARKHKLDVVAQQWLEPRTESLSEYIQRLEDRLHQLAELNPIFINSHTGRDFYSFEENVVILSKIFQFEKDAGIKVYHETHRGRFNYCAQVTHEFIKKLPNLKLTADLSHWVVVSESWLEDQKEALSVLLKNSHYIHARFGDTQRSQIEKPFDKKNEFIRNTYMSWWRTIAGNLFQAGVETLYICPEFGPKPYLNAFSSSPEEIKRQWKLNEQCKEYLQHNLGHDFSSKEQMK